MYKLTWVTLSDGFGGEEERAGGEGAIAVIRLVPEAVHLSSACTREMNFCTPFSYPLFSLKYFHMKHHNKKNTNLGCAGGENGERGQSDASQTPAQLLCGWGRPSNHQPMVPLLIKQPASCLDGPLLRSHN